MDADDRAPSAEDVREEIAREILRVHQESYGTGGRLDVQLSDDTVLIVIDVELTPAEQTLVDADQHEAVKTTREAYQEAIEPTFTAIVERATGRRVVSFLSAMNVGPLYSIEFFRLEPRR